MEHTQEPWHISLLEKHCANFGDGRLIFASVYSNQKLSEVNARRIVACVNACAGISTENLENNAPLIEAVRKMNAAVKQREVLLESLEDVLNYVDRPPTRNCSCHISPPCGDCVDWSHLRGVIDFAESAIAKAEA